MKKSEYIIFCFFLVNLYSQKSSTESAGDIVQLTIPAAALITTILLDDKEGIYQFAYSFGTAVAVTHIAKNLIPTERPDSTNKQSFVSGHTSAAFQGASFIHLRYGLKYAIIPYIGAAFVGYSRVHSKKHYTDDVLRGFAVGVLSAYIFTKRLENPNISIDIDEKTAKLSAFIKF